MRWLWVAPFAFLVLMSTPGAPKWLSGVCAAAAIIAGVTWAVRYSKRRTDG